MISAHDRRIWLASGSPRRAAILEGLGFEPRVEVADVPEVRGASEAPIAYARRLAEDKGRAVRERLWGQGERAPSWIVAADTIVALGDQTLEKPADAKDAERMLAQLAGQTHAVTTAFWLGSIDGSWSATEHVTTRVRFRAVDHGAIARYVATGEPMDKAGAYGIQGLGGFLVDGIEGSYFSVVGLPVAELIVAMERAGALEGYPWPSNAAAATHGGG